MLANVYEKNEHGIDQSLLDPDALLVLKKLKNAGFVAYLVGGGVRDLLAGIEPKDFDVSTSATPVQVKALFKRQCLLIGRRFRLAHIRFRNKVIEVATFRRGDDGKSDDLILHDNDWGSPDEDVLRRDFTINGLFYDPADETVIDYVEGYQDIKKGLLKSIGDPCTRFKQDPVRMIRLAKFEARFGFSVDEEAAKALIACREEVCKSSPSRLLEELLRMLESGASVAFLKKMVDYELLDHLMPKLADSLRSDLAEKIYQLLATCDKINKEKETLARAVLASVLLFPLLEKQIKEKFSPTEEAPGLGKIMDITRDLLEETVVDAFTSFPKKLRYSIQFILNAQYRLTPLVSKRIRRNKLLANTDFPLALEVLFIRKENDPSLKEDYLSWLDSSKKRSSQQRVKRPQKKTSKK